MALSVTLAMLSQATLAAFLGENSPLGRSAPGLLTGVGNLVAQRYLAVKTPWTRLPLVQWRASSLSPTYDRHTDVVSSRLCNLRRFLLVRSCDSRPAIRLRC
jgi:hypothetical protein